ncbi:MAG: hypothetical protein QOF24_3013 [Verrucomicrobiota bacterium]|jgi:hypothetical protein
MNAREQARFDMLKRVGTFGTNNASDFTTPVPPAAAITPGQTQATHLFDDLNTPTTGLIARIGKNAETQHSGTGSARGGTTSKTVLRDALFLELKGINRTAAATAAAQNKPEIMDKFRMPYGVGDAVLVAKANTIGDAAQTLATDFIAHGHEPTFVADLRAHISAFGEADAAKDSGAQTQAGATEGFAPLLDEAMTAVTQLDAFMHNFYKSNAAKMGEWHTASHVERQAKTKKAETPAPPKP